MQAYLRTLGKIKSSNSYRNPGQRKAKHRIDNGAEKVSIWGRSYPSET